MNTTFRLNQKRLQISVNDENIDIGNYPEEIPIEVKKKLAIPGSCRPRKKVTAKKPKAV